MAEEIDEARETMADMRATMEGLRRILGEMIRSIDSDEGPDLIPGLHLALWAAESCLDRTSAVDEILAGI